MRERLRQIWIDPQALDLTKRAAAVTRDIARRLADVSKALENNGCNAEDVAHFLMRCLFTMFTEDVELLPRDSFKTLLAESCDKPEIFTRSLKMLWKQMDEGDDYSFVIRARVRRFNGGLFKNTTAFELKREEIGELLAAAQHDWKAVDPAIFGTLLEQALDKTERRKLGAHYTPRAYVQRLVDVTIMEPLRADWQAALTRAKQAKEDGDEKKAVAAVRAFHHQLCTTRVLDPACGTGNFLYVALELMKKLEGEVLEVLAELGEPESMGLDRETVDPHQFLGLEINPRAAAIAELVIWLGYLQQHYRTRTGHPSEPILRDFKNINFGQRGGYDAVLTWNGYPVPEIVERDGTRVPTYPNARRPEWPEAELIVGNPPFMGGKDLRSRLALGYAEALWRAHPQMNESADFVMYWWDRAAELLTRRKTVLRRFGLVTTNSISQVFQRRTIERHLSGKPSISFVFAVPDQPWIKVTRDTASVRIAMSVLAPGLNTGQFQEITSETALDSDQPKLKFRTRSGYINADLTIGVDVTKTKPLTSNEGLCFRGITFMGAGFIISPSHAEALIQRDNAPPSVFRRYLSGRDLTRFARGVYAIDLFKWDLEQVRINLPNTYQHLLETVKPVRDADRRGSYRDKWWMFAEPRPELRRAIEGLPSYIATSQTAKHRIFRRLQPSWLPDQTLVVIASSNLFIFGVLASRFHVVWSLALGGWLGVGNDHRYSNSRTFNCFPFPLTTPIQARAIGVKAQELSELQQRALSSDDLTLTLLYNVLEKLRIGSPLNLKERDIKDRGLLLILKELHEEIDRLTAEAYGWPLDLSDEDILARLVALNAERAKEEAAGLVRWLRPEYQIPRFGKQVQVKTGELDLPETVVAIDAGLPAFPTDSGDAALAVEALLAKAAAPMTAAAIARGFKRGGKRVEQKVVKALTTLVRYGHVTALDEEHYLVRRAA